jgi:AraC-like DNA-binding protein
LKYSAITVLALVTGPVWRRLGSALPEAILCLGWADIERVLTREDRCVVFVDPLVEDNAADEVRRLRERFAGMSVVVCATLEPNAMRGAARLGAAGATEIVVSGFDDTPERLKRLVEDLAGAVESRLAPIEANVQRLPDALENAVREMFRRPASFRSTLDLAAAADMSARATFRHLKKAGFRSPRRLVASARVIRATLLLRDRSRTASDIAMRLGYRCVDQLSLHLGELTGFTANDIKKARAPANLDALVLRGLVEPLTLAAPKQALSQVGQ